MEDHSCSLSEQIQNTVPGYRHLVILGAGASKALCLHNPEKNNKTIPLMNDLPQVIDISEELYDLSEEERSQNFEKLFSFLYKKEGESERIKSIQAKLYDYFQKLQIADTPTIYDFIILSLRAKDMIATFNWDPFLVQAYTRIRSFTTNLPELVFLHGNVAVGFDELTSELRPLSEETSLKLLPTKLLYPIENKNYSSDKIIESQWKKLLNFLDTAAIITIFGYSAPNTDKEAKKLMRKVWNPQKNDRYMPQIEIIDIADEKTVRNTWQKLLSTHHYSHIRDIFVDSWLFNFPRRSGEMFYERYVNGRFQVENKPPKFNSLDEMGKWYSKLIMYERAE